MKSGPLIIGHRGASAVAPENTIAAFREALAVGADGIEFDVRLTRDGVPVVIHDSTLRRTGRLPHRVAELTWAEISKIDIGSWFAETFADETVPSLAELFALFQSNNSTLYLEMKCDSPTEYQPLAEACVRAIEEHALKSRVVVECFQLPAIKILKETDPEIKTVALFESVLTTKQRIINEATDVGASALALHHRLARGSLVQKAKAAGLNVAVWTVDDPVWIDRARAMGINALITNNPAVMLGHR